MKSGDFSDDRGTEYFRREFGEIRDREFEQRSFSPRPALVAKEPVEGHRMSKDYHGEPYDVSKFDLVEGMWDHEHCSVCWFTINAGHTYWENVKRKNLLCDACYEAFLKV
jgi:hypothetical protein